MRFSGFSKETLASMFPGHEKREVFLGVFVGIVRCGAIAESDGVLEKWTSFRYLSFHHFYSCALFETADSRKEGSCSSLKTQLQMKLWCS